MRVYDAGEGKDKCMPTRSPKVPRELKEVNTLINRFQETCRDLTRMLKAKEQALELGIVVDGLIARSIAGREEDYTVKIAGRRFHFTSVTSPYREIRIHQIDP